MYLGSIRASDIEDVLGQLGRRQHGVVGLRQLRAMGIDARRLRPLFARGAIKRLSEAVVLLRGTPATDLQRVMAGVLDAPPGACASHQTAAALWRVPGFPLDGEVHVTVPRQGTSGRRTLATVHFFKEMPLDEVVLRTGIPTVTPTLTAFQLCAQVHPAKAERAFDAMTVRRLTSGERLGNLVDRLGSSGRNGTRQARELVKRHGRQPPPESGLEQRVEYLGRKAGLELDRQVRVGEAHLVGRADFRIRGSTGLIEAQSLLYHSSPLDSRSDQERIGRLLDAGFSVLTIWDSHAFYRPDAVVEAMVRFKRHLDRGDPPQHMDCSPS